MPTRRRRVQDKWKMKKWYTINSPPYFGGINIGLTPASDPEGVLGRTVEVTLYDITGDPSQMTMKLYFQVTKMKGNEADTIFKGHEYSNEYLKSLVRRRSTRIDSRPKVTTKDGYTLRVSVVIFSVMRAKDAQKTSLRKVINQIVEKKSKDLDFEQFVQEAVLGKIASDIYNLAKKIIPIRHIGVRKSKVIACPSEEVEKETVAIEAEAQ